MFFAFTIKLFQEWGMTELLDVCMDVQHLTVRVHTDGLPQLHQCKWKLVPCSEKSCLLFLSCPSVYCTV